MTLQPPGPNRGRELKARGMLVARDPVCTRNTTATTTCNIFHPPTTPKRRSAGLGITADFRKTQLPPASVITYLTPIATIMASQASQDLTSGDCPVRKWEWVPGSSGLCGPFSLAAPALQSPWGRLPANEEYQTVCLRETAGPPPTPFKVSSCYVCCLAFFWYPP